MRVFLSFLKLFVCYSFSEEIYVNRLCKLFEKELTIIEDSEINTYADLYRNNCKIVLEIKDHALFEFSSAENQQNGKEIEIRPMEYSNSHHLKILKSFGQHFLNLQVKQNQATSCGLLTITDILEYLDIKWIGLLCDFFNIDFVMMLYQSKIPKLVVSCKIIRFEQLRGLLQGVFDSIELKCAKIEYIPERRKKIQCKSTRVIIRCADLEACSYPKITLVFKIPDQQTIIRENLSFFAEKSTGHVTISSFGHEEFIFRCPPVFRLEIFNQILAKKVSIFAYEDFQIFGALEKIRITENCSIGFQSATKILNQLRATPNLKHLKLIFVKWSKNLEIDVLLLLCEFQKLETLHLQLDQPGCEYLEPLKHMELKFTCVHTIFLQFDSFVDILLSNKSLEKTIKSLTIRTSTFGSGKILDKLENYEKIQSIDIQSI